MLSPRRSDDESGVTERLGQTRFKGGGEVSKRRAMNWGRIRRFNGAQNSRLETGTDHEEVISTALCEGKGKKAERKSMIVDADLVFFA